MTNTVSGRSAGGRGHLIPGALRVGGGDGLDRREQPAVVVEEHVRAVGGELLGDDDRAPPVEGVALALPLAVGGTVLLAVRRRTA